MMLGRNSMGYIWHQGTIYEATSDAVPVFLEWLRQPATPGKHDVLAFLALLFTGRSSGDVHQHTALLQSEVRKPGFQQRLEQVAWVQATKDISSCRPGSKGRKTLGLRQKYRGGASLPRLLSNQTTLPASFSSSVLSCLAARRPLCAWRRPTDVRTDLE
jgi:hypothetical protein